MAKLNISLYGRLHNMTPYDAYSITIQVGTLTVEDISHKQKE